MNRVIQNEFFIKLINRKKYILGLNFLLFVAIVSASYHIEIHYQCDAKIKQIEHDLSVTFNLLKSIIQRLSQYQDENIIKKILNEGYGFPIHLGGLYYVNGNDTYTIWGRTHTILTPTTKALLQSLPQDGMMGMMLSGKEGFVVGKVEENKPHYLIALLDEVANQELYHAEILIPSVGENALKNKDKIKYELKKYNVEIVLDQTTLVAYLLNNKWKLFFVLMSVLLVQIFIKYSYLYRLAKAETMRLGAERRSINVMKKFYKAAQLKPYFLRELTDLYQNKLIAQLLKIAKDVDDQQDLERIKLKLIHFTTTVQSASEGIALIEGDCEVHLLDEIKLSLDMLLDKISDNEISIKYNGLGATLKTKPLLLRILFYNLFDEIIESLPPHGSITIDISTSAEEIGVFVTDNGYAYDSSKIKQEKRSNRFEGLTLTASGRDKIAKLLQVQIEKTMNATPKNQTQIVFHNSSYQSFLEDVEQNDNTHLIYKN